MEELVRQIQTLKTYPGAIDKILPRLRRLYQNHDIYAMVSLLNSRKYATGRVYQVMTTAGKLTVSWEAT